MKTFILFFSTFLMACGSSAQERVAVTSENIKAYVETRNSRVAGKAHSTAAMDYRKGFLKRSFLPSLQLRAAHERFTLGDNYTRTQPDYGAEVSINVFNGTKDMLGNRLANKSAERAQSEQRVVLYEEIIRAKALYWNLVFLNAKLQLLEETLKLNGKNLKSAMQRIKGGVATRADRFEFEMKATELSRELAQTEMRKRILHRDLVSLLGFDENTVLDFKQDLSHEHDLQRVSEHNEKQHEFLAKPSSLKADENELASKIQSRSWWPRLDAYAGYNKYNVRNGNVFDQQEGRETVVGLRLTMNTSDLVSGNREASALKAEAAGAKAEAQYLEREVENEAHSEIEELHFLHGQVHSAEDNIQKADQYFKLTLSEYSRGVKNSPDVLGATDKIVESKIKYLEILRDFQVTRDHLITKSQI